MGTRTSRTTKRKAEEAAFGRAGNPSFPNRAPDPISDQKPKGMWTVVAGIAGFALAVGIAVLAVCAGVSASGLVTPVGSGEV